MEIILILLAASAVMVIFAFSSLCSFRSLYKILIYTPAILSLIMMRSLRHVSNFRNSCGLSGILFCRYYSHDPGCSEKAFAFAFGRQGLAVFSRIPFSVGFMGEACFIVGTVSTKLGHKYRPSILWCL